MDLYTEVKEHFDREYPKEGCGVITVVKGKKQWVPVKNIAIHNDDFLMDSEEYFKLFLSNLLDPLPRNRRRANVAIRTENYFQANKSTNLRGGANEYLRRSTFVFLKNCFSMIGF